MIEIEKKVLHELVKNTAAIKMMLLAGVNYKYFQYTETRNLFLIVEFNYKQHQQVLQSDTLQSWLTRSQKMNAEEKAQATVLFEEVKLLPDFSDVAVLIEDFIAYYKTTCVKNALDKSVSLLSNNQPDKAMSQLKTDIVNLERATSITQIQSGYFAENYQDKLIRYDDEKLNPEKYKGMELGFRTIDNITNGLPKGSVTIIIGSQKSAKSVLLGNIAFHNFNKGKRVYYHVNEGGKDLVENRFACRATGLVMDKIERRQLSDTELALYKDFFANNSKTKRMYIDSVARSNSTVSYIEQKVNELRVDGPVDLIMIDYMSLMKSESSSSKKTYEVLGDLAMDLKDLAGKLQLPIITIMHVNRDGMKDKDKDHFGLEDMGLSNEPSKHVDLVLSWRVKDGQELKRTRQGQGVLSVEASRFCGEGDVTLQINTNLMKISEYDLAKVLH